MTDRDLWLLDMLLEHTVLTSTHLTELLAVSRRSVNRRLATLIELGVLQSFRPHHRPGSAPEHFVLAPTGAALLAARYATTPGALGWHRDQATRAMFSPFLTHDLGARSFFTQLTRRGPADERLAIWWSEKRCAQLWGDLASPDGYGQYGRTAFLLEYDTGTESLPRLAAKLDTYAELAAATHTRPLVLFTLHSTAREANLHDRLRGHPALDHLASASTSRDQYHPADRAWLPLGEFAQRTRLAELPVAWPVGRRPGIASTDDTTGTRSAILAPAPAPPAPDSPAPS
ncbi:hypothetical protein C7C46_29220 [Streptomyces tateyamensis]|uniref:Uncharacterized protein n=1 Tax=Streptomyces tateyamensis TaxID=565073 RepID=A0A2V4N8N9_9ACTN|nr:replication-relaxation family protein [Streptomyces tateyamensis]PYC68367.1 hypothetical protein C7C46_29220 [Streptomyces tateyamensis]